jgi:hypothetical protein
MQKIIELTEKEFMTGIAPSSQVQDKGLWLNAQGITVSRDLFSESDNVGILQGGPVPHDLSDSVADGDDTVSVSGKPFAWAVDPIDADTGLGKLYVWCDDGSLLSIDLEGDTDPVQISGTQTNGANGLFVFLHSTGKKAVYYFRTAGLGWYGDLNGSPSLHTDDFTDGIEDTPWHPTHRIFDRVYFGNARYIGQIQDDGAGSLTINGQALDFEPDDRVNCISDDGTYLVAGITKNTTAFPDTYGRSRVIFWDTNQDSWQREWEIPDGTIMSIQKLGTAMVAVTTRGLFAFTYTSKPVPLVPYFNSLGETPNYQVPTQNAADIIGEAILWGGVGQVSSFGKLTSAMPNAYFKPFAGFPEQTATMVAAGAKANDLYVGTDANKLFRIKLTEGGLTGIEADTVYIDLKRWWQVGKVIVAFDGPLQDDDTVAIALKPDDADDFYDVGQPQFSIHGAIRLKELYTSLEARKLQLSIDFSAGAVRIRNIQVWGDPLETPTHSRANVGVNPD